MAYSLSTFAFGTGGRGVFSGHLYRVTLDFSASRIHLPPSCSTIEKRPSVRNYKTRQYLVGGHTANLVIDEELRALRQGIGVPPMPNVTANAGATPYVIYYRFFDELTGEKSSIGAGKVLTGGTTRTYVSVPTSVQQEELTVDATVDISGGVVTGADAANFGNLRPGDRIAISTDLTQWAQIRTIPSQTEMLIDDLSMAGSGVSLVVKPVSRVSHVESWISATGGLPRFGTRVRIGTTGFVETIADLALGEALVDTYEPMPVGSMNVIYNDRQIVAGVPGSLDTAFLSAIGFPERHEGLRFVTQYGEPILGLFRFRDYVMLICHDSTYRLQGYTEDDYVRDVLEPARGGIGHLGNRLVDDYAIIPGRNGPQIFNGAFNPGMPNRRKEWTEDYSLNPIAFEAGYGAVNPIDQSYIFLPDANRLGVESPEAPVPVPVPDPLCSESSLASELGITTESLYVVGQGVSSSVNIRAVIYQWFDPDSDPPMLVLLDPDFNLSLPYADINEVITTRDGVTAYIAATENDVAGTTTTAIILKSFTRGTQPVVLATFSTSESHRLVSIIKTATDVFLSSYAGAFGFAATHVYRYDGAAITIDEPAFIGGKPVLRELGSDLYCVYMNLDMNRIYHRTGGTWTSLVMPSFVPASSGFYATAPPISYGGILYCFGFTGHNFADTYNVVYTVSGSTVAEVLREGPYPPATRLNRAFPVLFDGFLYYFVTANAGGGSTTILSVGRFDGITWNDSYKDLTLDFGTISGGRGAMVFDGAIRLLASDSASSDCAWAMFSSPGSDIAGTWVRIGGHFGPYELSVSIITPIDLMAVL